MQIALAGQTASASDQAFHILIVEDDRHLRESLSSYLIRNQFRVKLASNAFEARRQLARHSFDLIVLDVMMPGEDGLSLCRHIRAGVDVPVVLISAKAEDTDRIVGIEIGADDYVNKPFNPRELLARMKAIIRRAHSLPKAQRLPDARTFAFGEWVLKLAQQELIGADGVTTAVSSAEFRLLIQFLLRPRTVLSRDQLIAATQGREAEPYERGIDNLVARIRKKIEPDIRNPIYIKTIWGGGYMLAADVERQ